MQASSIAIIDAGVIPCIRIMARIIVLHMSAQFMHEDAMSADMMSMEGMSTDMSAMMAAAQACMDACAACEQACTFRVTADVSPRALRGGPPAAMVCLGARSQQARIGS
jgi:hypothetical protein